MLEKPWSHNIDINYLKSKLIISFSAMKDFANTNYVSIIQYDGCVSLPNLLHIDCAKYPPIQQIQKSRMNKNGKIISCVAAKMLLPSGSRATLKVYAAKISVKIRRNAEIVIKIVKNVLKNFGAEYQMIDTDKKVDITFSNFGIGQKVEEIEEKIKKRLKRKEMEDDVKSIEKKLTIIHITGIRTKKQIDETRLLFEELFLGTTVYSNLNNAVLYSIMSNCKYEIGYNIAIWELTKFISTAPGFENCFSIYDNLVDANCVTIVLPLNMSKKISKTLWRTNIEASFIVKNTGFVTQSTPSAECGKIAYELFCGAIKFLGERIIRY